MRPRLIIMLKEPRPGRVKTRLAADIGTIRAVWWFRHQTRRLLRNVYDPRWQTVLAIAPDLALHSRAWPAHLARVPQGRGDLGVRMGRAMSGQRGKVCVIGADIPGITRGCIAQAFRALGRADAVLGPAPDGGYWLIGLKHASPLPAGLFNDVRWSGANARADTIASLGHKRVALAACLRDVDRAVDLP